MFDHRLSLRLTAGQMAIAPTSSSSEGERGEVHELWRRLPIAPRPLWKSLVNQIFLPMDWSFDRIFSITCHLFPRIAEECAFWSPIADIGILVWAENISSQSAQEIARNRCNMSPESLSNCLAALRWIHKDTANRYLACIEQVQRLDEHIKPNAMPNICPQWTPSPRAGECLKWLAQWAERINEGRPIPQRLDFGRLTREQSGEIAVGILAFKHLYKLKELERSIIPFVQSTRLAKTMAKISIFAPPILMLICPKIWPLRLSIPLGGLLLFIKAAQLYYRSSNQFTKHGLKEQRITYWFSMAYSAVWENIHEENRRMERAEARKRRRETEAFNRAKEKMEQKGQFHHFLAQVAAKNLEIASLKGSLHQLKQQLAMRDQKLGQTKFFQAITRIDRKLYSVQMHNFQRIFSSPSPYTPFELDLIYRITKFDELRDREDGYQHIID